MHFSTLIHIRYGSSINYVVSVGGEGGSPKDDLLHRPYLIKKTTRSWEGGGSQKLPILRQHSLWTAPCCASKSS